MDLVDWEHRFGQEDWREWRRYLEAIETTESGMRNAWALNILCDLCDQCGCSAHPESLPTDTQVLRTALEVVLQGKSKQLFAVALKMLRRMLGSNPKCTHLLDIFPRHRQTEVIDPVLRQRKVITEDAIPKRITGWVREIFNEILLHDASATWRTSRSANQNFHLIHRFLRATGFLESDSSESFKAKLSMLGADQIIRTCQEFSDKFCFTSSSARRYLVVFNHIFHRVWAIMKTPIRYPMKKRKIYHLAELDERLSSYTSSTASTQRGARHQDYFNEVELSKLRQAASQGRNPKQDTLIIVLLQTTGLRRSGLLNIKTESIAGKGEGTGRWIASHFGVTLTKGSRMHKFMIHPAAARAIEDWLNSAEVEGGRPRCPSPYLFPSRTKDNGQLSHSELRRIFLTICKKAGFEGDPRCHLHAMRHSFAHSLENTGNTTKAISVALGHRSTAVTEAVYLRDTTEQICKTITNPSSWVDEKDDSAVSTHSVEQKASGPPPAKERKKEKASCRELAQKAKQLLEMARQ